MINISFDRIYLLLIAIPLVAALVIPYAISIRKSNRSASVVISLVLHLVMAALITFAAAGTQVTAVITETQVYVVADVSYSANQNLDLVDEYVRSVQGALPDNSEMGVVVFGKDCKLLTPLGGKVVSVKDSGVDDSATDIKGALDYTGSLFGEDVVKRIVLITDGKQSEGYGADGLVNTIEQLHENDVYIDAIYVDDNIADDAKEVQVTSVEFTSSAYCGHEEKARVLLQSGSDGANVTVELYQWTDHEAEKEVVKSTHPTLSRGYNIVEFPLTTDEANTYHYEVSVRAIGTGDAENADGNDKNNNYTFTQTVSNEVNVLLLTTNEADRDTAQTLYGDKATITAYVNTPDVPFTVEQLVVYDEIVLSEVDVREFNNYVSFTAALDTVVSEYGKSLVTMGDTNIQNQPDDVLKDLEDMLPVTFGNSDQDPKLLTLVIDVSRSMEELSRLTLAKQAALQMIELLNDQDALNVIWFSENVSHRPYFQVGPYRTEITNLINSLKPTQGTMLSSGMNQAIDLMEKDAHTNKQIVLITDGYTYTYDKDDPVTSVQTLYDAYGAPTTVINTCTVDNGTTDAKKALALLNGLSAAGGTGSAHYVENEDDVTRLILEDIANEMTESIVNTSATVTTNLKSDAVLDGIETLSLPNVNGFVYAKSKSSATTVLNATFTSDGGKEMTAPLYAYWDYGNGKVSTFTSSLSGSWTSAWKEGDGKQFFQNILTVNTPDEKSDYPFSLSMETENGGLRVNVTPATLNYDTAVTAEITLPSGETRTERMIFNGSSYYYVFDTPTVGRYEVKLTYQYPYSDTVETTAYYHVSYPEEYDSFTVFNVADLHKAIRTRGNVYTDGNIRLVNDKDDVATYTYHLTMPFMIAAIALFVVDVVIRKLRWADIRNLFGLREKKKGKGGKA